MVDTRIRTFLLFQLLAAQNCKRAMARIRGRSETSAGLSVRKEKFEAFLLLLLSPRLDNCHGVDHSKNEIQYSKANKLDLKTPYKLSSKWIPLLDRI